MHQRILLVVVIALGINALAGLVSVGNATMKPTALNTITGYTFQMHYGDPRVPETQFALFYAAA
jgi:hypothetical protein